MWSILETLYELIFYIFKNINDIKWEALIGYSLYLFGKRSGMKMFRKFMVTHFKYLEDEDTQWRNWVSKQLIRVGGEPFLPQKEYRGAGRSKKLPVKNYDLSSTRLQEGIDPERRYPMERFKILVADDDGHGMETAGKRTPPFADGTFMHENEFNRAVIDKLNVHLKRNDFDVLHVSAGDTDVPLKTRTDLANNTIPNGFGRPADIMVSVHANALGSTWNPKAKGIELFYREGSKEGKKLALNIQEFLVKGTPLINRGLKTANLHITRESQMPAVLIEGAFMDNPDEALLLKSDAYRSECAEEIARGICQYFGRTYIEVIPPAPPLPSGVKSVSIVIGSNDPLQGLIIDGRSWVPAKQVLVTLGVKTWVFEKKSVVINGTAVETKIINNTSYIKSLDLQPLGLVKNVFMDPDAIDTKRVLIIPKESVTNE
ncbi:N-acetylmuramoyl-L-alanine amidase LytC precursor [compost metagenome]